MLLRTVEVVSFIGKHLEFLQEKMRIEAFAVVNEVFDQLDLPLGVHWSVDLVSEADFGSMVNVEVGVLHGGLLSG